MARVEEEFEKERQRLIEKEKRAEEVLNRRWTMRKEDKKGPLSSTFQEREDG